MSKRDPSVLLEDMIRAVSSCMDYVQGISLEEFCQQPMRIDAVSRCFQVLGDAAKKMPPALVEAHPEIPWPQMRGLRNRIVHEYFDINLERTWQIIQDDLPKLHPQLKALLPDEGKKS